MPDGLLEDILQALRDENPQPQPPLTSQPGAHPGAHPGPTPVQASGKAARIPDTVPKRFSCFLSHYKLEAGTEARLVQVQLKDILAKGANSEIEIFLDSGKARTAPPNHPTPTSHAVDFPGPSHEATRYHE